MASRKTQLLGDVMLWAGLIARVPLPEDLSNATEDSLSVLFRTAAPMNPATAILPGDSGLKP